MPRKVWVCGDRHHATPNNTRQTATKFKGHRAAAGHRSLLGESHIRATVTQGIKATYTPTQREGDVWGACHANLFRRKQVSRPPSVACFRAGPHEARQSQVAAWQQGISFPGAGTVGCSATQQGRAGPCHSHAAIYSDLTWPV